MKNLTEDERIQLLHDAGYPEVSEAKHRCIVCNDTGEEIDDGEITVMASSPIEARNEALRMLEEGGLDDEEYYPEVRKRNLALINCQRKLRKNMKKKARVPKKPKESVMQPPLKLVVQNMAKEE